MTTDLDFSALNFDVPDEETPPEKAFDKPIYTCDAETDPFEYKKVPRPFAWGLFDGERFQHSWGNNCTDAIIEKLYKLPPGIIYMHNGGKFDIYFMIRLIFGQKAFIVNRRIVKAIIPIPGGGHHEVRDSYAIMPFPLAEFQKGEIDYQKMREDVREKHKAEILEYLELDCVSLWQLCSEFIKRFGPQLTIGGLSMKHLRAIHPFECLGPYADADVRQHYYYGGRVECLQSGILPGPWKIYDVNSMFPAVMRNTDHPLEMPGAETVKIRKDTCFITVEGSNYGAFPFRTKNEGIRFDIDSGIFHVSIHEFNAAIDLGLFKPRRILRCVNYRVRGNFATFVDTYYSLRKQAKDSGDPFGVIFYKYLLNSSYGKLGQNPDKYAEWKVDALDSVEPERGKRFAVPWEEGVICEDAEFAFKIWTRATPDRSRYNIATGASITGAARATLMRAIASADTPIYCDTDSIVCRDIGKGVEIDKSKLGTWKLEQNKIHTAMIARKKLYAMLGGSCPACDSDSPGKKLQDKKGRECHNETYHTHDCCKLATKGVELGPDKIREVCEGKIVIYRRDAPTFKLDGSVQFIERKIKI